VYDGPLFQDDRALLALSPEGRELPDEGGGHELLLAHAVLGGLF
jgi:hypothetical protein